MVAHFALLQVDVAVIGSSFLRVLGRLAFEVLPETGTITYGNISEIIIAKFPHSTYIKVHDNHWFLSPGSIKQVMTYDYLVAMELYTAARAILSTCTYFNYKAGTKQL